MVAQPLAQQHMVRRPVIHHAQREPLTLAPEMLTQLVAIGGARLGDALRKHDRIPVQIQHETSETMRWHRVQPRRGGHEHAGRCVRRFELTVDNLIPNGRPPNLPA